MNKEVDKNHIWHPYSSILNPQKNICVKKAKGSKLFLNDGKELIDGMSSWWCAIHGYSHPKINRAIKTQIEDMSHVMFGGITHSPVIELTKKILKLVSKPLEYIFYSDSGSVAIEVAMKMAIQYSGKHNFISFYKGYHGDTMGAMSVCDPNNGMHTLFTNSINQNFFIKVPKRKFNESCKNEDFEEIEKILKNNANTIAGIIIEPILQGAGGMNIYSPSFLKGLKELSVKYNVLLIFDEIATGFGRTGKMFAYEHAAVVPDILCIGKALTGGHITFAATITTKKAAQGIEKKGNILMHGPTYMANPLACKVASASLELLCEENYLDNVHRISDILNTELMRCLKLNIVKDVRVLGAVGIVELHKDIDLETFTNYFVKNDVWIRPFKNLIYIMPPYILTNKELKKLSNVIYSSIKDLL